MKNNRSDKPHGNTGNKNASKGMDSHLNMRCRAADKTAWAKKAQLAGKKLSEWVIDRLNNNNMHDLPTCETCRHWKSGSEINHGDHDMPYCTKMHGWVNMNGTKYPHTAADFGCVKHSDFDR